MPIREPVLEATAGEVQRNFGQWQDRALRQPVRVTRRGRPQVVMLSVEEYERLRRRDQQALPIEELSEAEVAAIAASESPVEAEGFDDELA